MKEENLMHTESLQRILLLICYPLHDLQKTKTIKNYILRVGEIKEGILYRLARHLCTEEERDLESTGFRFSFNYAIESLVEYGFISERIVRSNNIANGLTYVERIFKLTQNGLSIIEQVVIPSLNSREMNYVYLLEKYSPLMQKINFERELTPALVTLRCH
ncbi:unnamed protein product [marine sediment metagenome]|uniref:Uncharacterized protein n=1 Tax=marine sediment metagenome TaxID=412755 RepID=X1V060_9ZZZZ